MNDFIRIGSNPPPDGAEQFDFIANDGARIRAAFFPKADARGCVVMMTGWSEFIEKYFETVRTLQEKGFSVAMLDWRGQGLSDRDSPRTANWDGYFDTLTADLRAFTEQQVRPRFGGPLILITHSMGGVPALKLLASGYDGFSRAVLSAPMTRLFSGPMNIVFSVLASIACAFGFANRDVFVRSEDAFEFEGNIFTSDRERHQRFRDLQLAEPNAAMTAPTYGWVRAAIKASSEIHSPGFFAKQKTPTLIVSAGDEKRVDGGDHQAIAASSELIGLTEIPGALHEILVERNEIRDQFFVAFDRFIAPVFSDAV